MVLDADGEIHGVTAFAVLPRTVAHGVRGRVLIVPHLSVRVLEAEEFRWQVDHDVSVVGHSVPRSRGEILRKCLRVSGVAIARLPEGIPCDLVPQVVEIEGAQAGHGCPEGMSSEVHTAAGP